MKKKPQGVGLIIIMILMISFITGGNIYASSDTDAKKQSRKAAISDLRKRQENDERSTRVRVNSFPASSPESECTAADRARARLEKSMGEGVEIQGDLKIDSKNEVEVGENKGSINNSVNVNIINNNNRRC